MLKLLYGGLTVVIMAQDVTKTSQEKEINQLKGEVLGLREKVNALQERVDALSILPVRFLIFFSTALASC